MLAILILIVSLSALAQFWVAYTRSLLRTYAKVELSQDARRLAGFEERADGQAFDRIVFLLGLAPGKSDDALELFLVRVYYLTLRLLIPAGHFWPALAYWITAEHEDCAHFAAVALDRRVASGTGDIT